ncbi:hypothetical protein OG595_22480 [Streptomyces sp. NBC_01451]|nr:hypothetical protein [Streptomyces sp. NBC_01451]
MSAGVTSTPDLVTAVRSAKQFLTYMASGPSQYAVAEALALPDTYFEAFREDMRVERDLLGDGLRSWRADRRGAAAVCRLPSAVCRLPSAVCRLPSAVCRLPSAYDPINKAQDAAMPVIVCRHECHVGHQG